MAAVKNRTSPAAPAALTTASGGSQDRGLRPLLPGQQARIPGSGPILTILDLCRSAGSRRVLALPRLRSWPAGAGYRDRKGQDLPGAGPGGQPLEVAGDAVGLAPLGGHDEQGPPVRAAEHQRERCPVLTEFDALQDLAALGDADDRVLAGGDPDRAFGVETDSVRAEAVGEDSPVRQSSVGVDVERGETSGEGFGDDQRPVVGGDDHAVGELDVARDLAPFAVRRAALDVAALGRLTTGEVEVRAVEVDVAAAVHDDLVRALPGVGGHRPVGLLAP